MYSKVNLSIFLLASFWRPLSPNNKSCVYKKSCIKRYVKKMFFMLPGLWFDEIESIFAIAVMPKVYP